MEKTYQHSRKRDVFAMILITASLPVLFLSSCGKPVPEKTASPESQTGAEIPVVTETPTPTVSSGSTAEAPRSVGTSSGSATGSSKPVAETPPEPKPVAVSPAYDFASDASIQKFVSPERAYSNPRYLPSGLVSVEKGEFLSTKSGTLLRKEAYEALLPLSKAFSARFKKPLTVVSGYRSFEYQARIEKNAPECVATRFCAKAGHSEHQSGLAFDLFETTDRDAFLAKPELREYFDWLEDNAHLYGFTNSYRKGVAIDGYHEEPWHWRFVGVKLAKELKASGKTFSEFVASEK